MMTEKLLAWYGSQPLKEEVMERLRKHRADDAFVQQTYQEIDPAKALGYRGCALGCTLPKQQTYDYRGETFIDTPKAGWTGEIQRAYGIRAAIAAAIEDVFETLPPTECADFVLEVVDAIPVGADLEDVREWAWERGVPDGETEARTLRAELIERLSAAPVPTPA